MSGLLVIGDDQIISVEALAKLNQRQIWREKSDEVFDVETFGKGMKILQEKLISRKVDMLFC